MHNTSSFPPPLLHNTILLLLCLTFPLGACDTDETTAPRPAAEAPVDTSTRRSQPESDSTVAQVLQTRQDLSTFRDALEAAGILDTLDRHNASLTVFAPTNDAFDALPEQQRERIQNSRNGEALTALLSHHIIEGSVYTPELNKGDSFSDRQDGSLTITRDSSHYMIDHARIVVADLPARNGVVHIIDAVLIPPAFIR